MSEQDGGYADIEREQTLSTEASRFGYLAWFASLLLCFGACFGVSVLFAVLAFRNPGGSLLSGWRNLGFDGATVSFLALVAGIPCIVGVVVATLIYRWTGSALLYRVIVALLGSSFFTFIGLAYITAAVYIAAGQWAFGALSTLPPDKPQQLEKRTRGVL